MYLTAILDPASWILKFRFQDEKFCFKDEKLKNYYMNFLFFSIFNPIFYNNSANFDTATQYILKC